MKNKCEKPLSEIILDVMSRHILMCEECGRKRTYCKGFKRLIALLHMEMMKSESSKQAE